jgi:multiple sugar transport system permease protein
MTASRAARKRSRRRTLVGLAFVSPWIIGFLTFALYPFLMTFYYSFTNFDIVRSPRWIGFANYTGLMHDHIFWQSLWNTGYYTVLEVPFSTIVAIGLAMLLNMKVRGMAFYRTALYLPTIVPLVASCIVWMWLFNPSYGIINDALSVVHVNGPGWIFSASWSKPSFVFMGLWSVGAPMVIYLAALQGVPEEMYEVADLEGAGPWQRTWHVTLPMISPAILFNVVLAMVAALQYFTQAYVMTQGGPSDSTMFYSLYLYEQAFSFLHLGYASAMAWLLFVIVVVITLVMFRSSNRWVYYANE